MSYTQLNVDTDGRENTVLWKEMINIFYKNKNVILDNDRKEIKFADLFHNNNGPGIFRKYNTDIKKSLIKTYIQCLHRAMATTSDSEAQIQLNCDNTFKFLTLICGSGENAAQNTWRDLGKSVKAHFSNMGFKGFGSEEKVRTKLEACGAGYYPTESQCSKLKKLGSFADIEKCAYCDIQMNNIQAQGCIYSCEHIIEICLMLFVTGATPSKLIGGDIPNFYDDIYCWSCQRCNMLKSDVQKAGWQKNLNKPGIFVGFNSEKFYVNNEAIAQYATIYMDPKKRTFCPDSYQTHLNNIDKSTIIANTKAIVQECVDTLNEQATPNSNNAGTITEYDSMFMFLSGLYRLANFNVYFTKKMSLSDGGGGGGWEELLKKYKNNSNTATSNLMKRASMAASSRKIRRDNATFTRRRMEGIAEEEQCSMNPKKDIYDFIEEWIESDEDDVSFITYFDSSDFFTDNENIINFLVIKFIDEFEILKLLDESIEFIEVKEVSKNPDFDYKDYTQPTNKSRTFRGSVKAIIAANRFRLAIKPDTTFIEMLKQEKTIETNNKIKTFSNIRKLYNLMNGVIQQLEERLDPLILEQIGLKIISDQLQKNVYLWDEPVYAVDETTGFISVDFVKNSDDDTFSPNHHFYIMASQIVGGTFRRIQRSTKKLRRRRQPHKRTKHIKHKTRRKNKNRMKSSGFTR
jgi:hypothetical protein